MATGLEQTAVNPHNLQPGQVRRSVGGLAATALDPLRRAYEAYQRSIGQPFQQAVRGGVRGYFGLPMMSDADALGREAYRQAEALGYTPGVGMPAGAVRLAAEGVQALPSIAGDIGRLIAGMPSGAGAAQAEDFARYQRSIPPSDVSPLTAFHGTPYTFEPTPANPLGEFRAAKIGSGEGAQAYGYGLYFAESPGVAKGYQAALSGYSADGKRLPSDIGMVVSSYKGDVTAAIADRQRQLDKWLARKDQLGERVGANVVKGIQDEIKKLSALQGKRLESTGSLYTVDIPDSMVEKMLDWDKPLSEQPKSVQDAVENIKQTITGPFSRDMTGDQLLRHIQSTLKSVGRGSERAEDILRQQGIPGIRYLDAGSRGSFKVQNTYKGKPYGDPVSFATKQQADDYALEQKDKGFGVDIIEGTRNIVVFPGEESKVKILKRD